MNKNLTLFTVLFVPSIALAGQSNNKEVGEVAASFLQINPSVRAAALGGHQATLQGSGDAMHSNPAALTTVFGAELSFSHNQSFIDTKYGTLGFAMPYKNCAFGVSAQYINDGTFEKTGEDGSQLPIFGLGNFKHSTLVVNSGAAFNVNSDLSFGGMLKGWQESADGSSKNGWAADAGLQMRAIADRLDLGLVARNLGPAIDGKSLPISFALGGAYHLKSTTLMIEAEGASHQDLALRAGVEYSNSVFSLRGGFENLRSDLEDSLAQFSFGAGTRIKGIKVDYAFVPRGVLGDEHRVGISFGFGLSESEKARVSKEVDRTMAQRTEERAQTYFNKAEMAFNNSKWNEAIANYNYALEWNPNNKAVADKLQMARDRAAYAEVTAEYKEGVRQMQKTNWVQAALHFEKTLSLSPSHKDAAKQLNIAKLKINKDASDIPRDSADLQIEKARRMAAEKELERMKQAARPDRDELDIMDQQANTLFMLGQTQKAIEMWQEVLRRDSSRESVKMALRSAMKKKDAQGPDSTVANVHRVSELNSKAMAAYGNGELSVAAHLWRQALKLDPQNVWAKRALARVEMEMAGGKK